MDPRLTPHDSRLMSLPASGRPETANDRHQQIRPVHHATAYQAKQVNRVFRPNDVRIADDDQQRRFDRPNRLGRPILDLPSQVLRLFDERRPVVRIRRDSQIFLFKRRASQVFRLQLINPGEQPRVKPVAVERYGNNDQLVHQLWMPYGQLHSDAACPRCSRGRRQTRW